MNRFFDLPFILALAAFTGMLASPVSRADTTNCTVISSLPVIINAPGIYCLTKDFEVNLPGEFEIFIQTNFVTLDLNGHKIDNTAAGVTNLGVGIYAYNQHDITIRNGTLAAFGTGVGFDSGAIVDNDPIVHSFNDIVEDMHVIHSTVAGISGTVRDSIIRNNIVSGTGTNLASSESEGILVWGPGNRVINNDILAMVPKSGAAAIFFPFGSYNIAVNNHITQAEIGIDYDEASGKYRDNVTSGVATPYFTLDPTYAINAGNNN